MASPPTASLLSDAERRLHDLLSELSELAPELSEATLVAAARRVSVIAGLHAAPAGALEAGTALALDFAEAPAAAEDDELDDGARSDAGSIGSLAAGPTAAAAPDAVGGHPPPMEPYDDVLWPGGPSARQDIFDTYVIAPADFTGDAEDEDGRALRDTRLSAWHGRDSIGLSEHGRHMFCDCCDPEGARDAEACMAADMLQQRRISMLMDKHLKKRKRVGELRDHNRSARYEIYREVVKWQWDSGPLGAEQRVRLPKCVMVAVRRAFPNPRCGSGCDYGPDCEQCGHYVGFRTAAQSRALREGEGLDAA